MPTITKIAPTTLQAEIPQVYWRYIASQDEKVLEVVLVYNGVDRYDTIIEPEGMRTDPSVVTINYNHKGVSTGAYLTNCRVERNYKVEGINGKEQVIESCLVGEIHVPKHAEMFYFDTNGQKRSNGNLYEAIEKGYIRSVSVGFRPVTQATNTRTGITTFKTWDLLELSVLDVTPGQPMSGIKVIRMFDELENSNDTKSMSEETKLPEEQVEETQANENVEPTAEPEIPAQEETEARLADKTEIADEADKADVNQDMPRVLEAIGALSEQMRAMKECMDNMNSLLTKRMESESKPTEPVKKKAVPNADNAVNSKPTQRSAEEKVEHGSLQKSPAVEERPKLTKDDYFRLLNQSTFSN